MSQERGVTIISATHDFKMLNVSDRVVWIRDGRIDKIEHRDELSISLGTIRSAMRLTNPRFILLLLCFPAGLVAARLESGNTCGSSPPTPTAPWARPGRRLRPNTCARSSKPCPSPSGLRRTAGIHHADAASSLRPPDRGRGRTAGPPALCQRGVARKPGRWARCGTRVRGRRPPRGFRRQVRGRKHRPHVPRFRRRLAPRRQPRSPRPRVPGPGGEALPRLRFLDKEELTPVDFPGSGFPRPSSRPPWASRTPSRDARDTWNAVRNGARGFRPTSGALFPAPTRPWTGSLSLSRPFLTAAATCPATPPAPTRPSPWPHCSAWPRISPTIPRAVRSCSWPPRATATCCPACARPSGP